MTWAEVLSIGASIIASLGGAGILVFALSGWLGKLWADKIMQSNKAEHDRELAALRANLQRENHLDLEKLKAELTLSQQQNFKGFEKKLEVYSLVVDIMAQFLLDIQYLFHTGQEITEEKLKDFDVKRMKTFGYLSLTSPQEVIDAHEQLVEAILESLEGTREFSFSEIRECVMALINEARKDIGLNNDPIEYRGNR